jgi:hypothetical protein
LMLIEQHRVREYGTRFHQKCRFVCFKTVGKDVVNAVDACASMKSSVVCLSSASERAEQQQKYMDVRGASSASRCLMLLNHQMN